jgi:hypothetical protein
LPEGLVAAEEEANGFLLGTAGDLEGGDASAQKNSFSLGVERYNPATEEFQSLG